MYTYVKTSLCTIYTYTIFISQLYLNKPRKIKNREKTNLRMIDKSGQILKEIV